MSSIPTWKYFTSKKQWEGYLKALLRSNDLAVRKAIVLIYNRQTEPERATHEASEENGVGFTKHDAATMSKLAERIERGEELTESEMAMSRNKMGKYWRQLMEISLEQQKHKEEAERLATLERRREQFRSVIRDMQRCANEGKACEFGICDECPVTQGVQMRMTFKEDNFETKYEA